MTDIAVRTAPSMGTRDLIVLYLTSLIGAGILVIPGITAQLAAARVMPRPATPESGS